MTHFPSQYATASPVLMVSSQSYYQTQLSAATFGRHHSLHMNHKTTETPMLPGPVRSAGRKRSRDEASINLEPDLCPTPAVDSLEDWANEVGMVLIRSANTHVADAKNHPDSFMHRSSDVNQKAKQDFQIHRFEPRNQKSQRLDRTTQNSPLYSTLHQPTHKSSPGNLSSSDCHDALVIDDFTVHLGIGWRSISGDEHIQAAARGWARFIENNFGLARVRICLESKGLQSYLIEASSGYFLFAENLRQGRLVSPTAEGALKNLQSSPPIFEGPELAFLAANGNERVDTFVDVAMVLDS